MAICPSCIAQIHPYGYHRDLQDTICSTWCRIPISVLVSHCLPEIFGQCDAVTVYEAVFAIFVIHIFVHEIVIEFQHFQFGLVVNNKPNFHRQFEFQLLKCPSWVHLLSFVINQFLSFSTVNIGHITAAFLILHHFTVSQIAEKFHRGIVGNWTITLQFIRDWENCQLPTRKNFIIHFSSLISLSNE